jgi:hypothetical protein
VDRPAEEVKKNDRIKKQKRYPGSWAWADISSRRRTFSQGAGN